MKQFTMIIIAAVLGFCMTGCPPTSPSVIRPQIEQNSDPLIAFNGSNTWTVGSNSYVAINVGGQPSDKVPLILSILKKFEDDKPDLVVLDWKIEYFNGTAPQIYGLWIHHKSKQ